jgi:Ca2+-transporting ATPase
MWCERHGSGAGMVDTHELTLFFTTFVFIQAWNLLNAKCVGSSHSAFHHFLRDTWLIAVLLIIFGGQWLIVTFGGKMFRTEPLSFNEWIIITVATSAVLWIGELIRLWKRLISTRTTKR